MNRKLYWIGLCIIFTMIISPNTWAVTFSSANELIAQSSVSSSSAQQYSSSAEQQYSSSSAQQYSSSAEPGTELRQEQLCQLLRVEADGTKVSECGTHTLIELPDGTLIGKTEHPSTLREPDDYEPPEPQQASEQLREPDDYQPPDPQQASDQQQGEAQQQASDEQKEFDQPSPAVGEGDSQASGAQDQATEDQSSAVQQEEVDQSSSAQQPVGEDTEEQGATCQPLRVEADGTEVSQCGVCTVYEHPDGVTGMACPVSADESYNHQPPEQQASVQQEGASQSSFAAETEDIEPSSAAGEDGQPSSDGGGDGQDASTQEQAGVQQGDNDVQDGETPSNSEREDDGSQQGYGCSGPA